MQVLPLVKESLLHFFFPHICEGCGTDIISREHYLCVQCLNRLPLTDYHLYAGNPVEKVFWGRIPLAGATAQYYFTKHSLIQQLMHQVKYKGNKELAFYLGKIMGQQLAASNRFIYTDGLIPLPHFPDKEKKRGFNQATVLSQGIASVLNKPVLNDVVCRSIHTETQTKKNRIERWQNMENGFALIHGQAIENKHVVLVDDVITTGATLEACGRVILQVDTARLSIASLCFSAGN
jgi:ComF family protein